MKTKQKVAFDETTQRNIDFWLEGRYDQGTKDTIKKMLTENPREVVDAFYTHLNFGTGGLRGIMGVGSNRINIYTIRAATQGLANYIKEQPVPAQGHSVFIGYDSRQHSRQFAEEAAKVLAGNGIAVYIFKELRPTPLVSYGCRYKKCSAAIMITASHNPPEYNGYKVYWSDGAQVLPPHDRNIIAEVRKVRDPSQVKCLASLDNPLVHWVGEEVDEAYLKMAAKLQNYPDACRKKGRDLKIVYTSLHGTGITMVPKVLAEWGFTHILPVESQIIPDGTFPTVKSPNPEERPTLSLGIDRLLQCGGDILIANDPDADRAGVAVRHHGEVVVLNGNQIACLCLNHILEALSSQHKLPEKGACIKTIGTTELFQRICDAYKIPCFNVLTGFKYIAEMIRIWEESPDGYRYIFGGEESYGYLIGTEVRDKDAVTSAALICEAALHAKEKGLTLVDKINELYKKYGYFYEKLLAVDYPDTREGRRRMADAMEKLREKPPASIGGIAVSALEDYETSIKTDVKSGKGEPIALPRSNVLLFRLEDGSKVMIRPSGTEPKVKLYCGVMEKAGSDLLKAERLCLKKAEALLEDLNRMLTDFIKHDGASRLPHR